MIFDLLTHFMTLSNCSQNEDKSEKFDFGINFTIELSTIEVCNASLDALMFPVQIIKRPWTSIIDPSWCKCMLYSPTPKIKWKFWLWHQFFKRAVNGPKNWNVLLDSLNVCKCMLYPPPIKMKNYSIGHKSETGQPKKITSIELHIFIPLCKFLGQN